MDNHLWEHEDTAVDELIVCLECMRASVVQLVTRSFCVLWLGDELQ